LRQLRKRHSGSLHIYIR